MSANPSVASQSRRHPQQGYALLMLLVMVAVGGLYALFSQIDRVGVRTQQQATGGNSMQQVKEALLAYATTYPENHANEVFGYLPCPDTDGDGEAESSCGATDITVVGLLPYKTLGLPDLRDTNSNCLWYAVSGKFKNNPKTSSMNWDTQGQITLQNKDGLTTLQPQDASGGGAAAIFAVGTPLGNQSRTPDTSKACGINPTTAGSTNFIDSAAFTEGTTTVTIRSGTTDSTTNNDIITTITPLEIFSHVKGRTTNSTTNLAAMINGLRSQITTKLATSSTLLSPINPTVIGSLTYGALPTISTDAAWDSYLSNWKNQFFYAVCTNGSRCINAGACTGVLLFGGERGAMGPRSTAELTQLTSFFEGTNLSSLTTGATTFDMTGTLTSTTKSAAASTDLVTCLNPTAAQISGVGNFQSSGSASNNAIQVITNPDSSTELQLGSSFFSNLYGCSWYPSSVSLSSGLRVYFRFNIADRGEGFTFTLADTASNASTGMCGADGPALGYSGSNNVTAPIYPPKLGLEIDTNTPAAQRSGTTSRGDPNSRHAAFIFWGPNSPLGDQDNRHGACGAAINGKTPPCNPSSAPGRANPSVLNNLNTDVYVRLDIVPDASIAGRYALSAYITSSTQSKSLCELDGNSSGNLASDVEDITTCDLNPSLTQTLDTGMLNAYMGFTFGQGTSNASRGLVSIDKFKAQSR